MGESNVLYVVFVVLLVVVLLAIATWFLWQLSGTASSALQSPAPGSQPPTIETFRCTPPFVTNKPSTIASKTQHRFELQWNVEGDADYIDISPSPWDYSSESERVLGKTGSLAISLIYTKTFELIALNTKTGVRDTKNVTCQVREHNYAPGSIVFNASPSYSTSLPTVIELQYSMAKSATSAEIVTPDNERIHLNLKKGHAGTFPYTANKSGTYVFYLVVTHFDGDKNSFSTSQASMPPVVIEAGETLSNFSPADVTPPPPIVTLTWNRKKQKSDGAGLPYAKGYFPDKYEPSVLTVRGTQFALDSEVFIRYQTGYTASVRTTRNSGVFSIDSKPIGYISNDNISIVGKDLSGTVYQNYARCLVQNVRILSLTMNDPSSSVHQWSGTEQDLDKFDVSVNIESLGSPDLFVFETRNQQTGEKRLKTFANVQPSCVNQLTCLDQPLFLLSSILAGDEGLSLSSLIGSTLSISVLIDNTIKVNGIDSQGSTARVDDALSIQIV